MQRCLLAVTNIYPLQELSSFEYAAALVSRHLSEAGVQLLHSSLLFPAGHLTLPSSKELNFPRSGSVYGTVIGISGSCALKHLNVAESSERYMQYLKQVISLSKLFIFLASKISLS